MDQTLVFDRPPIPRLISCAAVFASAALVFHYVAESADDLDVLPFGGLILLFLGTLAAAIAQYGDHIYIGDDGAMYENTVLRWLGKRGRWLPWDDVVEIREIRGKVLILLSANGRRLLVDAVTPRGSRALWQAARTITPLQLGPRTSLGYAIARAEILRRAPQALVSGTLARDHP